MLDYKKHIVVFLLLLLVLDLILCFFVELLPWVLQFIGIHSDWIEDGGVLPGFNVSFAQDFRLVDGLI